jgi:hypothetical protein
MAVNLMPESSAGHAVNFCDISQKSRSKTVGQHAISVAKCDVRLRTVLAVLIETNIAPLLAADLAGSLIIISSTERIRRPRGHVVS